MFTTKKGFTLIELLVVIAIIAILAAILFPVFAQAREKARAANCLSNTKQIGTALNLYVDDYDETVPLMLYNQTGVAGADSSYPCAVFKTQDMIVAGAALWGTWMDAIFPYVKNRNIFICPSGVKGVAGYGFNDNLTGGYTKHAQANATPICLSQINNASQLVFVGDTLQRKTTSTCCMAHSPVLIYSFAEDSNWRVVNRHNDGMNWTFCDGHAKYYKKTQGPGEARNTWAITGNVWWTPDAYKYNYKGGVSPFFLF